MFHVVGGPHGPVSAKNGWRPWFHGGANNFRDSVLWAVLRRYIRLFPLNRGATWDQPPAIRKLAIDVGIQEGNLLECLCLGFACMFRHRMQSMGSFLMTTLSQPPHHRKAKSFQELSVICKQDCLSGMKIWFRDDRAFCGKARFCCGFRASAFPTCWVYKTRGKIDHVSKVFVLSNKINQLEIRFEQERFSVSSVCHPWLHGLVVGSLVYLSCYHWQRAED